MTAPRRTPNKLASEEALKKALQQLGFTEHEARAYIALADASPATAYEVAQRSGLPRANAYNVLWSLAAKGAVQEVMRDPVKYVPVDANDFFGKQARQTSALCDSVAQAVKSRAHPDESVFVWAHHGEAQVRGKIEELIAAAERNIWIKGPAHLIAEQMEALVHAAGRGVGVILVVFGEDESGFKLHPGITVFLHEGRGTHRGASHVVFTMTLDGNSFMIASFTGEVTASYARNPSIVYVVETMILHEIYIAEMYAKIGPALDAMFGEHMSVLRNKYRPETMGAAMLTKRAGAPTALPAAPTATKVGTRSGPRPATRTVSRPTTRATVRKRP